MSTSHCSSDAGVSSPTAPPIRCAFPPALLSTMAIRFSAFDLLRNTARRCAKLATRCTRSESGTYRWLSLNEIGTEITRPSHSGSAIFIAASDGLKPRADSLHVARGTRPPQVRVIQTVSGHRSGWFESHGKSEVLRRCIAQGLGNVRDAAGHEVGGEIRCELGLYARGAGQ